MARWRGLVGQWRWCYRPLTRDGGILRRPNSLVGQSRQRCERSCR